MTVQFESVFNHLNLKLRLIYFYVQEKFKDVICQDFLVLQMSKTLSFVQKLKMITPSKTLNFAMKSILSSSKLLYSSQVKAVATKNSLAFQSILASEDSKINSGILIKNIGFGITQIKHANEILHEVPVENYLKKIQKTCETINCFSPKNQKEVDVPIRIFRTHYTVTFMPSVQYLEKQFSPQKHPMNVYHQEKDSVLATYKLTCKNCGHIETRSFPENGYKFGTVITGCDHCNHVELISDHLGWIQQKKANPSKDLLFNMKYVHDLIRKNLKKVGIDSETEPE